ncbi:hypothetical protein PNEG_02064 [Pneumocystis murina B123]|uniref:DUF2433 domain-containing protein n=1 Tax=Pneumocystis murina (strain B123) TaxID=1069680 RepID=M7NQD0_PNEMU|nr:hypothetical protein PNEG_02064 [Pneumocystis murina B123]EMR09477.1 hypothetical protein PNEG_02064 [Pneumocystis murina B123]
MAIATRTLPQFLNVVNKPRQIRQKAEIESLQKPNGNFGVSSDKHVLISENCTRILCIADIRGNISFFNELCKKANAQYIIHTGDFGFYDNTSLDRINERTLRHIIQYSPLIKPYYRSKFTANSSIEFIRNTISHSELVISELPSFLSGEKELDVPVYTIWGSCEDVCVLEKFRSGEYKIKNLYIIDEHSSKCLNVGDIKLRLFGLGGAVIMHKLFDNGEGKTTIAGGQGTMWSTVLQMGELLHTANKVWDNSEVRVFVTYHSPGREGLLKQISLALKADFTISAGLHFRYGSSYNDFSVTPSTEYFLQKLATSRAQFMDVWETVKDEVELLIKDTQRSHLQSMINLVESMPQEDSLKNDILSQNREKIDAAFKNMWNFNLPDAAYGSVTLSISEGRISAETKAQGFNFSYRKNISQTNIDKQIFHRSIQTSDHSSAALQTQKSNVNTTQEKLKEHSQSQTKEPTHLSLTDTLSKNSTSLNSHNVQKTENMLSETSKTLNNQRKKENVDKETSDKSQLSKYALFISPCSTKEEAYSIFEKDIVDSITNISIRNCKGSSSKYAFVYFISKDNMNIAKKKTISRPGLRIAEADLGNNKSPKNNQGLRSNFQKSIISEINEVSRGIRTRGPRLKLSKSRRHNNLSKDSTNKSEELIKDKNNKRNNEVKNVIKDSIKNEKTLYTES